MTKKSAFDELLEAFAEDDKQAARTLSERYPEFKDSFLRQSDYSRQMNENSDRLKRLNDWEEWRRDHWDDEHKSTREEVKTRSELERIVSEKQELESKLAAGDDMTFESLEKEIDSWASKKGFVTNDWIGKKEKELQEFVTGVNKWTASAALNVPYLMMKHKDEFGTTFDPEEFLKSATEKNRFDLRDYYEKDYVIEARSEKVKTNHDQELKRVQAEADEKLERMKQEMDSQRKAIEGMGPKGMGPTDTEGADMGSFQKKYLKLDQESKDGPSGAPEVALGEGGIAAYAANEWKKNQLANRS